MENIENKIITCPFCDVDMPVDSIREFTDGRKRIYWECKECNLSMMKR